MLALATTATAMPAHAAGVGQLCNVSQDTWVEDNADWGSSLDYIIPKGGGFRIEAGPFSHPDHYYWYGHGSGQSNGYAVADGRYYNCH